MYIDGSRIDKRRKMKNEHVLYNGEFIQYIRQNLKYKAANITQPLCNSCIKCVRYKNTILYHLTAVNTG